MNIARLIVGKVESSISSELPMTECVFTSLLDGKIAIASRMRVIEMAITYVFRTD